MERLTDQIGNVESQVYEFTLDDGGIVTIKEHSLGHVEGNLGAHFNVEVRPPGGGPGNHLQEEQIIMSSSIARGESVFVVQPGIATWEDLRPVVDRRWKTVSVFCGTLRVATPLLWAIVAARPLRLDRVLRVHLSPTLPSMTKSQKRRMLAELKKDPPGFSETKLSNYDTHVCVTSTLDDSSVVDLGFLTSYRRCVLIEVEHAAEETLQPVCATMTEFGAVSISMLLNGAGGPAVLRTSELETHSVIQLVGSSDVCDLAVRCLADRRIRQFSDIRILPHEIAGLRR